MVKPNVDFMQNYRPTPNRIFDLYNYYQGLGPTTGTPTTTTASVPGYNPFVPRGGDGGGGITSINPSGFKQTGNLFEIGPMSGAAPGSFRAAQDIGIDQKGRISNMLGKARDFGVKALASNMLSQGGAKLGFNVAGFPGALAGMIGGGILGFGARGPTVAEQVVGNFYGNMGNQPSFYRDPITGELVESEMRGYNISSAYGKGIGAAIDKRLARIGRTIQKKKGKVTQGLLDLQARLKAEKEALEAEKQRQMENLRDRNRARGTGGYQAGYSDDFMTGGGSQRNEEQESRSPGSSGPGGSDTMGST